MWGMVGAFKKKQQKNNILPPVAGKCRWTMIGLQSLHFSSRVVVKALKLKLKVTLTTGLTLFLSVQRKRATV